ncbi:hypothetical protein B7P43_G01068, partial [Cryptotermes secundus]
SGRPLTASTEHNKERVDEIIQDDRRMTVDTIAQKLGTGQSAVQEMIGSLGYRKVCACWVPRLLTEDHKDGWEVLSHPSYSPDLAPSDYHLFRFVKDQLRGQCFETREAIQKAVYQWNRILQKGNFQTLNTGRNVYKKVAIMWKNKERSIDLGGVFGLSIIKHVTLQKIVAHDFQYNPIL